MMKHEETPKHVHVAATTSTPLLKKSRASNWVAPLHQVLLSMGPGLMVCLADSDIGGLSTMAMAGSTTRYALLGMQLVLIPALYLVQELVVRLSLLRRQGLVSLVYEELGSWSAAALTGAMCVLGFCAIVSQFSGIVAVGEILGVSLIPSSCSAMVLLVGVVLCGNYHTVETVGLVFGACLGVFIVAAIMSQPPWKEIGHAVFIPPSFSSSHIRELAVANVGTVVTPWMLFFQGSALVEKRLSAQDLPSARFDTKVGSIVTQLVMAAVLIVFASHAQPLSFDKLSLADVFLAPLQPILGERAAEILLSLGLLGSSLLASLVVSLGIAWNLTECWFDARVSVSDANNITSTSGFRYVFAITIVSAAGVVICLSKWLSIAVLNVGIQILNGVLMPPIVGCVFYLATRRGVLPDDHRVRGMRAWVLCCILIVCSALAVFMAIGAIVPQTTNSSPRPNKPLMRSI